MMVYSLIASKSEDPWESSPEPLMSDCLLWALPACTTGPGKAVKPVVSPLSLFADLILGEKEAGSSEVSL